MATSFYWFDPKISTFFGPHSRSHIDIILTDSAIDEKINNILDKWKDIESDDFQTLHDLLSDQDWVRVYYNHDNKEFGMSCTKHKNALKTIRNFIKREDFEIKSLFLDINDIHFRGNIPEYDINSYIKYGKINTVQNV